jgi:Peptidase A4 family
MGGKLKIAATAVVLAVAVAAPAASASGQARASAPTCGPGGPLYVNGECVSANWAGLLAIGYGPYSSVIAYWIQPSTPVSNGNYEATAIWVGIGGGASGDPVPVQVGTFTATGPLGVAQGYSAVYQDPDTGGNDVTISGFAVHPGDEMAASVVDNDGDYSLNLDDMTTGQIWSKLDIYGNWPPNTAEIIVEAPAYGYGHLFYDLTQFGSVQFTNVSIGGVYAVQMVRGNRTLVSMALPSLIATYHYSS